MNQFSSRLCVSSAAELRGLGRARQFFASNPSPRADMATAARHRKLQCSTLWVLAVVAAAGLLCVPADAAAAEAAQGILSITAKNIDKVSAAFAKLLSDPYDLSGQMLPNDYSITKAGINPEVVKAAEGMRAKLRQSLSDVVDIAVNRTSDFVRSAEADLLKSGRNSSELLQRMSSIPLKFDARGNTLVANPLTAVGAYLVNLLQQQLKEARQAGGEELSQQLGQSAAGRKLLQEMDAFEASVDHDAFTVDLAAPSHPAGPLAVARQMDSMMSFLSQLTDVADDVMQQLDAMHQGINSNNNTTHHLYSNGFEADHQVGSDDPEGVASRKLQQAAALLPDPNAGYAKAVRLIFSNIFDFFRANGLYGLTPLIADIRGIFTRYNWIADLTNILDAPLENFINANYLPLPQNNTDFVKLVQRFAGDYCKLEKATSSETVLGEFEGPGISYEVKPVSCPIFTDPDTGRNYVSFADCSAATLTIKVTPLTITEAYFTAAEYVGTECKYVEPYGTDLAINIGGGKRDFSFVRSAKGIDIIPTVIQVNGRGRFHNFRTTGTPDTDLPGTNGQVGNGFFANNWGWSYNGVNPPAPAPAPSG